MNRFQRIIPLLLFAVAVSAWADSGSTSTGPSLSIVSILPDEEVGEVTAILSITNLEQLPVEGLKAKSFTVTDSGEEIGDFSITPLSKELSPATIALLIDTSGSMEYGKKLEYAKSAATQFCKKLPAGYQCGIFAFNERVYSVQGFTENRSDLTARIATLSVERKNTFLFDALNTVIEQMAVVDSPRKIIITLSDGLDTAAEGGVRTQGLTVQDNIKKAGEAGVVIYTIGLGFDVDKANLQSLAEQTCGDYFFCGKPDELSRQYDKIFRQLLGQYSLTYNLARQELSAEDEDAYLAKGERILKITVKTNQGTVSAERSYRAEFRVEKGVQELFAQWWFWLIVGSGFILLVVIILLLVMAGRRRRRLAEAGLEEEVSEEPAPDSFDMDRDMVAGYEAVTSGQERVAVEEAPGAEEGAVAELVVIRSPGRPLAGASVLIAKDEVLIGRDPACDIHIDSDMVSRKHARLIHRRGKFLIEDMDSLNGTYVARAGSKTFHKQGRVEVFPGDLLAFSREFIVELRTLRDVTRAF